MASKGKSKSEDMAAEVEVEATGPIRHGVDDKITDYAEGETFTVTRKEAIALAASGSAIQPGTKAEADTSDEEAKAAAAAIAEANEQAEAEKAAAAAEAAKS